jgi:hypothetical protein
MFSLFHIYISNFLSILPCILVKTSFHVVPFDGLCTQSILHTVMMRGF